MVAARAANAVLCLDAFPRRRVGHRGPGPPPPRGMVNQLHTGGRTDEAKALKNSRWALLKNPEPDR